MEKKIKAFWRCKKGRDGLHGFERELREAQSSLTEYKGGGGDCRKLTANKGRIIKIPNALEGNEVNLL